MTKDVENYSNGSTSTYTYTYDAGGNILTETVNGKVNSYVYDSEWKDKLISYNGKSITYDEAGHPTSYMGSTMTWDANDRLTSIKGKTTNGAANNISYTYLSDGSRRSKTVDDITTTYHYNNGLLLSQATGDETLYFYYDSTGKVVSIGYQKGSAAEVGYFFTRNAQGDIVGVYGSSDSKLIGTYEYDLWGKPVSTTEATAGIDTDGILTKNPFRYRGYYFDEETGFYYLNARYYDSAIRRFISADSYISTGQGLNGHNKFAYCGSNPVNRMDSSGKSYVSLIVIAIVTAVLVVGVLSLEACDSDIALAEANDLDVSTAKATTYNCYGNALMKQVVAHPTGYKKGQTSEEVFDAVKKDVGEDYVRRLEHIDDELEPGEYKVALRCAADDYHFIRFDGERWYNKSGTREGVFVGKEKVTAKEWYARAMVNGKEEVWYPWLDGPCYDDTIIYFAIMEGWDEQ